jgi:F0F1-type ATP synthase assembly protein I
MDRSEEKKAKDRKQTIQLLTMISQFGIHMLVPIILCFYVGYRLDRHFGTSYLTVILFFVGALAGFRNVYLMAKRYAKNDPERMHTYAENADDEDEDRL